MKREDKIRLRKINDTGWERWEIFLPGWTDPLGRASTWKFYYHGTAENLMLYAISEYRKREAQNA